MANRIKGIGVESCILSGESMAEAERNAKNYLLLREATY